MHHAATNAQAMTWGWDIIAPLGHHLCYTLQHIESLLTCIQTHELTSKHSQSMEKGGVVVLVPEWSPQFQVVLPFSSGLCIANLFLNISFFLENFNDVLATGHIHMYR